jgi:hypothetical protein
MADPKKTDLNQSRRFKEAARELGCEESEERFNTALRKVASAPPAPMHRPDKGETTDRETSSAKRCKRPKRR